MVTYTKENLKIKEKEMEYCIIRMVIGMMGNGKTMIEKEWGYYIIIKMIIVIEKKGYGNMIK